MNTDITCWHPPQVVGPQRASQNSELPLGRFFSGRHRPPQSSRASVPGQHWVKRAELLVGNGWDMERVDRGELANLGRTHLVMDEPGRATAGQDPPTNHPPPFRHGTSHGERATAGHMANSGTE